MHTNQLSGSIPAEICLLSNVTELYVIIILNLIIINILFSITFRSLHTNQLTGCIPPEIGTLSELVDLYVYMLIFI